MSQLEVIDLDGNRRVVFTADEVIEAPNWSPDGLWLVFNAGGPFVQDQSGGRLSRAYRHARGWMTSTTTTCSRPMARRSMSAQTMATYTLCRSQAARSARSRTTMRRRTTTTCTAFRPTVKPWPMSPWSSPKASAWSMSSPFLPQAAPTRGLPASPCQTMARNIPGRPVDLLQLGTSSRQTQARPDFPHADRRHGH